MLTEMAKVDEQLFSTEAVNNFFDQIDNINRRIKSAKYQTQSTSREKQTHQTASGALMGANINIRHQQNTTATNFQTSRSTKLNIFIQNAHSIRGKVDELRLATISCLFEIIIFIETWLNSTISNEEHFSSKYNVYRCDRSELTSERRDGDGVLIAIDAALHSERVIIPDSEQLEHVCVKIKIGTSTIILFAV